SEEDLERPLVLLIATGTPEREIRLAAAADEGWGERCAWALSRFERIGKPLFQPKHLRSRAEGKAELRDHGSAVKPAATRHGGDHVPEAVDDIEVDGVSPRGLADAGAICST